MSVSLTATRSIKTALALFVVGISFSAAAYAEDRTAGKAPAKASVQRASSAGGAAAPGPDGVDYKIIESYGLPAHDPRESLGRDLWRDSKHSVILARLTELPQANRYRTLQDLSRRLLLATADTALIKYDAAPQAGSDLLTLRLEKLLEIGAYEDAFTLYSRHPESPYHERLARAGILAAFYSRQPALGCLEVKTLENRFEDVPFWQQVSQICAYILSKTGKAEINRPPVTESKILRKMLEKESYRYRIDKFDDFAGLTPLEVAGLVADKRFDMSRLEIGAGGDLPLHVVALLMKEPSLSADQRFSLTVQAASRGILPVSQLARFYEEQADLLFGKQSKTSLADYQKITGWKRVPYLYKAARNVRDDREGAAIAAQALRLVSEYGTAPLWPFADTLARSGPEEWDFPMIRNGFTVLLETGHDIPDAWQKARFEALGPSQSPSEHELLYYAAFRIGELSTNTLEEDVDFIGSSEILGPKRLGLLGVIYETLDNGIELHNISGAEIYENNSGLTSALDYVMPLGGLMEDLETAEKDRRLGEVILLSSIALGDIPPERIDGGLLREVIGGFLTVGLTKEARSLAREVILGFSK